MTPPQRVFINSLPKSGTHLLTKAIELFGYQEYATHRSLFQMLLAQVGLGTPRFFNYREANKSLKKFSFQKRTIGIGAFAPYYVNSATLQYWLQNLTANQYIQGHIPWHTELETLLAKLNYRHFMIIRDPRAVLASLLSFILEARHTDMGAHFLEADFKLMSPPQRLNFILEGGYAPQAGVKVNSFATVYQSMLAWRGRPGCLLIRFEDLVGEQGGGYLVKQQAIVQKIALHLNMPFNNDRLLAKIYDPSARTFRIGKIDSWKHSLDPESLERLIEYCIPLSQDYDSL